MKRQIIIEIEYPETFDHCWNADVSGMQVFSDTMTVYASFGIMKMMANAITKAKENGLVTEEQINEDSFCKHIQTHADVIESTRAIGYIDDKGDKHYYNRLTGKWEP